jgi:hypothetical protein
VLTTNSNGTQSAHKGRGGGWGGLDTILMPMGIYLGLNICLMKRPAGLRPPQSRETVPESKSHSFVVKIRIKIRIKLKDILDFVKCQVILYTVIYAGSKTNTMFIVCSVKIPIK